MATASELAEGVRDLVVLPRTYLKIQSLLRDPNCTLEDFSRAVQTDPALAARLLRVANSAFFGVSRKVETISLAINLMGISRLHDLVLATAVIGAFNRLPAGGVNMASFWRRSIHVGILARMLAEECGIFDSERLFVSGLLHDIGHLIMYMQVREAAAAALRRSRADSIPLPGVEREDLGFHYGEVGAALMANWCFPESLQEVCQLHTNPARAQHLPRECSLVAIAQHAVFTGDPDRDSLPFLAPLAPITLELTGLTAEAVVRVTADSCEHLIEAVDILMQKKAA